MHFNTSLRTNRFGADKSIKKTGFKSKVTTSNVSFIPPRVKNSVIYYCNMSQRAAASIQLRSWNWVKLIYGSKMT